MPVSHACGIKGRIPTAMIPEELLLRLEHVGIAVHDASASIRVFQALFGRTPYKTEDVVSEGVRTHFIDAGSTKIELLEALDPGSALGRHLETRGEGLHHLAFEVPDLAAAHARLTEAGFRLLGQPKEGADGKMIFFVHPKDTSGVLIELCASRNGG